MFGFNKHSLNLLSFKFNQVVVIAFFPAVEGYTICLTMMYGDEAGFNKFPVEISAQLTV